MEKLFLALIIILMLLAVPYFYKLYGLKQISKYDIPEKGDWVELSRGNIYFEWFLPDDSKEIKGTMVLVHGFSTPSFVWGGLINNFTSSGYKVLVYDHFGRGYSERPRIKYDKDLYVETLRELIESQQIQDKVHLVATKCTLSWICCDSINSLKVSTYRSLSYLILGLSEYPLPKWS